MSGGQEVAGSNPASPTERTLALQGFFSLGAAKTVLSECAFLVAFLVQCRIRAASPNSRGE